MYNLFKLWKYHGNERILIKQKGKSSNPKAVVFTFPFCSNCCGAPYCHVYSDSSIWTNLLHFKTKSHLGAQTFLAISLVTCLWTLHIVSLKNYLKRGIFANMNIYKKGRNSSNLFLAQQLCIILYLQIWMTSWRQQITGMR